MEYNIKRPVEYSDMDINLNLSITGTLSILQNMMTEFYGTFESDNISLKKRNNAAWVYTKIKLHFMYNPKWREVLNFSSYITKIKPARTENELSAKTEDGKAVFVAKLESCPIDLSTRKVRKLSDIDFPEDIEVKEDSLKDGFKRLNFDSSSFNKVSERIVKLSDIDYTRHTNNVSYVRFITDLLDSTVIDKIVIKDFEIHYMSESREGETLEMYMNENKAEKCICFIIKNKNTDKECIRALLEYE